MKGIRNSVKLIGHLGKDIEIREFEGGKKVARTSLATNDFYKNSDGEKVKDTQWHNIVAWNKTADNFASICQKGTEVAVEGKLVHREYTDSEGSKRYVSEVVVNEFMKLSPKKEALPF